MTIEYKSKRDMLFPLNEDVIIRITTKTKSNNIKPNVIMDEAILRDYGIELDSITNTSKMALDENGMYSTILDLHLKCTNTKGPNGGFIVGNKSAVLIQKGIKICDIAI